MVSILVWKIKKRSGKRLEKPKEIILLLFFCRIILVIVGIWVILISPIERWSGLNFPSEDELHYTHGKLSVTNHKLRTSRAVIDVSAISLISKNNPSQYSCAYNLSDKLLFCNYGKNLNNYHGKQVVIGWYIQKDVLWFSNKNKQLVTLWVEDKNIISYQDALAKIKQDNRFTMLGNALMGFVILLAIIIFFIPFGKK